MAGDDLHGLDLHVASRAMASAVDGGVRLTEPARAALRGADLCLRPLGPHTLRGLPGSWELHELASA